MGRNIDVSRDVDGIIKRCRDMGYGIAIASARSALNP
jgi:hypothetical protein